MQNAVTIKILGQEYKVRTMGDDAYVQTLSSYINTIVANIQKQGSAVTTMELMAVVLLNIADDVHKTRSELDELKSTVNERLENMINAIDQVIAP